MEFNPANLRIIRNVKKCKKIKIVLTRNDKYGNLIELLSEREITKTTAKNNLKKLLTNDESCDNLI